MHPRTSEPPLVPPGAPTAVTAEFSPIEVGEEEEPELRFLVSWTAAPETAGLITSSTVTATPVDSTAPVLTTTVSGSATSAVIAPLQRHTTYRITVTSSDDEGASQPSSPIEAYSEGTPPPPPAVETCEQNQGTIKLSPGLEETPHVQNITIKGIALAERLDAPTILTLDQRHFATIPPRHREAFHLLP
ncbi:MAG: fibronectin type III domain-containing protein [Solirubrobacteraceae bacterium]